MEQKELYSIALRQVDEERRFYIHLIIYLAVILGCWTLNAANNYGFWWAIFPTVGWGIGIFIQGLRLIGRRSLFGKDWQEKRLKELMDKG